MISSRLSHIPLRYLLQIAQRDSWRCHVCKRGYIPGGEWRWEIDHDISLAKGGTNHVSNLRLAHRQCNSDKRDA